MDRRTHSLLLLTVQMAFALFAPGSVRADAPQVAPSGNVVASVPSTYLRRGDPYHTSPMFDVQQGGPEIAASVSSTRRRGTQRSKGLVFALIATLTAVTTAVIITACFKLLGNSKKSTPAVRRLAGDDGDGGSCGEGEAGEEPGEDAQERQKKEAIDSIIRGKKEIEREKRRLQEELEGEEDKDVIFLQMSRIAGFQIELKQMTQMYAKELGMTVEELKQLVKEERRRQRQEEGEEEEVKRELGEEEKEELKRMAIEALMFVKKDLKREREELKKHEEEGNEGAVYERSRRIARLEVSKKQLVNYYARKLGMTAEEIKQLVNEEMRTQQGEEGEEEVKGELGEEEKEELKQRAIKFLLRGKGELKEEKEQLKKIEREGDDTAILSKRKRIALFKLENKQMLEKFAKRLGMPTDELKQLVEEERKRLKEEGYSSDE